MDKSTKYSKIQVNSTHIVFYTLTNPTTISIIIAVKYEFSRFVKGNTLRKFAERMGLWVIMKLTNCQNSIEIS